MSVSPLSDAACTRDARAAAREAPAPIDMGDTAAAFEAHSRWVAGLRAEYDRRLAAAAAAEETGAQETGWGLVYMMGNVEIDVEIDEAPVYRSCPLVDPAAAVDDAWLRSLPPLVHRQSALQG